MQLSFRGPSSWRGMWREEKVRLAVAGPKEAPNPALLATLRALVASWPDIKRSIAEFARALGPDDHVPLDPPTLGGFAAVSCGFDGELTFESITVLDPADPTRAMVSFYTGYPDGYATFEVTLVGGKPAAIGAFAA